MASEPEPDKYIPPDDRTYVGIADLPPGEWVTLNGSDWYRDRMPRREEAEHGD